MERGMRPLTFDEVRPFFRPEAEVEVELALTRCHLAIATQQIEAKPDVADDESAPTNGKAPVEV